MKEVFKLALIVIITLIAVTISALVLQFLFEFLMPIMSKLYK